MYPRTLEEGALLGSRAQRSQRLQGLVAKAFDTPGRRFAVQLWDGSVLPATAKEPAPEQLILRTPRALAAFVPPDSERRLAEAFVRNELDIEGDLIRFLEAASAWSGPRVGLNLLWKRLAWRSQSLAARLNGRAHSPRRDGEAVRYHYDLSNRFYALFLDEGMTYSCACFATGSESLEEAQRAKHELICRKLSIERGEHVLDIGCGWGGFLDHAARHHGATGVGITLSLNQCEYARQRLAAMSPAPPKVLLSDYRLLPLNAPFDKVVSIGMMEHIGRDHLEGYFKTVFHRLRPGGLFLNQAIADLPAAQRTFRWMSTGRVGFIESEIFPDSDLVPLWEVLLAAETAGFEVRDVESLREHYARTLEEWLGRLEEHVGDAVQLVGRERVRAWRLYLACSAVSFRKGGLGVYQVLLRKPDAQGREESAKSRERWYLPPPSV